MINILSLGKLEKCFIIERLNRFVVKIEIDNNEEFALLTNTGRLKDLIFKGNIGLCKRIERPKKIKYVLIGTFVSDEKYTLIDTRLQMKCFEELIARNLISWLPRSIILKRNARLENSLIDYLIESDGELIYVELKSAVLFDGHYAMYPDCPSIRGRRHVDDLIRYVEKGGKAMIVFIAAHPSAKAFKPSDEGDPILSEKIKLAKKKGVEIHAMKMSLTEKGNVYLLEENLPLFI